MTYMSGNAAEYTMSGNAAVYLCGNAAENVCAAMPQCLYTYIYIYMIFTRQCRWKYMRGNAAESTI